MSSKRKSFHPVWLEPMWEKRKRVTADRVAAAIEKLKKQGERVTLVNICSTVKTLHGVSISPNTIKRNPIADQIYRKHRSVRVTSIIKDSELMRLCADTSAEDKQKLYSKVARLRRISKDALIAKIIRLEQSAKWHKEVEISLRETIIETELDRIALKRQSELGARRTTA